MTGNNQTMAKAEEILSSFTEIFNCPVCLKKFNDPRILQCGHHFCRTCLELMAAVRPPGAVACPSCSAVTVITPGATVGDLPRPVMINEIQRRILEFESTNTGERRCDRCGEKKVAVSHYCFQCDCAIKRGDVSGHVIQEMKQLVPKPRHHIDQPKTSSPVICNVGAERKRKARQTTSKVGAKPAVPLASTNIAANQPPGTMTYEVSKTSLDGHTDAGGSIIINYMFRSGKQGPHHPDPGKPYHGTRRTAFLPDNPKGRKILKRLKQAFDAKLVFTIGRSATTGLADQVIWNGIHHKTNLHGGPAKFGYPDPTYLSRVKAELAAKGIK